MIYEKEKRYIIPFDDVPSKRAKMPEISIEERKGNFKEVELGFPEEVAIKEAKRCLSCRRCLGCALCWAECKPEAIDFSMSDEEIVLTFDEIIITDGLENAFYPIREELGYGKYANVITDLKLERMLGETGPTDGLIMSPLDGSIPKKMVFIQSYPEGDHITSSLIYGINEAVIALDRIDDLEVNLISPLTEQFKKEYLPQVEKIQRLKIIDGIAESVEQNGMMLTINYSVNGDKKKEEADLVVILTKPKESEYIQKIKSYI